MHETFNPNRFTLGMIFLFIIILVLSVFSGYYMNKLSNKTSAILKGKLCICSLCTGNV